MNCSTYLCTVPWLEFTRFRTILPNYPPNEIVFFAEYFTDWCISYIEIGRVLDKTGLHIRQLYNYLQNGVKFSDYEDYIRECEQLDYDLHDSMINRPKRFLTMHERTASILKIETTIHAKREFDTHIKEREILEFQSETLLIRQPQSMDEIISEGKTLHHCVSGYAERHAMGKLHILFIRERDKPENPFYTMEVNTNGDIVQVRGSHNCDPTPEVWAFVKEYQYYLQSIFSKKNVAQMPHERRIYGRKENDYCIR